MKFIIFIFLLLAGSSCSHRTSHLNVQTVYLTRESLASYYVESPDPMLLDPPVGQKLLVSWGLPYNYLDYDDLHLHISIRLKNHEEVDLNIPVEKTSSFYTYTILGETYFETKGILTYKVDLMGGGCILEEWRHQLWHEMIRVGEESSSESEEVVDD